MMADSFRCRGGARIGWVSMTWPFAVLEVDKNRLRISTLLGSYNFLPQDVVEVRKHFGAIKIIHSRREYPANIQFAGLALPSTLFQRIEEAGFQPLQSPDSVPRGRGLAFREPILFLALILWSVPMLMDRGSHPIPEYEPGPLTLLSLFSAAALSLAPFFSSRAKDFLLKPDRELKEVSSILLLVGLVASMMLLVLGGQVLGLN